MALIVQKFGGSSVADADRIRHVAELITNTYKRGNDVVVVLSAQGDTTDDLLEKAYEINPSASAREMDMLLATGEQQSIALMAMAIDALGYPAVSLTGWQVGLETNSNYGVARIKRVSGTRIREELDRRRIVLVAGFQGINKFGDQTTLGRGGSDTTAVALAVALKADLWQIYTDVDGIYTADPRLMVLINGQKTENQWGDLMEYEQEAIERAISLAATMCLQALRQGVEAGFGANMPLDEGEESAWLPPLPGRGREKELLRAFACLRVKRVRRFPTFLEQLPPLRGVDYIILSCYDSEEIRQRMAALRRMGCNAELVLLPEVPHA